MTQHTIYVVEDNLAMRLGMVESLRREGHDVHEFTNAPDALNAFQQRPVALIVTDLKMEPMTGIDLLKQIKAMRPETEVLLVSAYGSVENAVTAMQLGAADFLTKPFPPEELRVRVQKILEKIEKDDAFARLQEANRLLDDELGRGYEDMIGRSPAILPIYELIDQVAKEDSPVLIEGESGTGKELIARAIHRQSDRTEQPFIRVNCGALNDNLLESELFGHEKGAFTGAVRQKKGRFELAHKGTLFLDEVGDISPAMQIKLLRALQEGEFERVGGEQTLSVDVRIVSATHRNLQQMLPTNQFRSDLYYRLNVIPIKLPPLRERKEDIPLLVTHFLARLAAKRGQKPKTMPADGVQLLTEYTWPGNIRELENLVERLHVVSRGPEIEPPLIARYLGDVTPSGFNGYDHLPLTQAVEAFEKNLIVHAMTKTDGVKNRAAKLLGIGTSALYYKLEKYGLL